MEKLTPTQEKSRQKKLDKILDKIGSGEERKILDALEQLKQHGDARAVPYMIDLYLNHESGEVIRAVKELFLGLNDPEAVAPVLTAVKQDIHEDQKEFLLSALWQAGLDASSRLDELTDIALKGEITTIFEAMTVAETGEGPADDEMLKRNIEKLKTEIENSGTDNKERVRFLSGFMRVLTEKMIGE